VFEKNESECSLDSQILARGVSKKIVCSIYTDEIMYLSPIQPGNLPGM